MFSAVKQWHVRAIGQKSVGSYHRSKDLRRDSVKVSMVPLGSR